MEFLCTDNEVTPDSECRVAVTDNTEIAAIKEIPLPKNKILEFGGRLSETKIVLTVKIGHCL